MNQLAISFLPRMTLRSVAVIYSFYRWVYDAAHNIQRNSEKDMAAMMLQNIEDQIDGLQPKTDLARRFVNVCARYDIPKSTVKDLIDGMRSHLISPFIKDDRELLIYSYRALGSVALMMNALAGKDREKSKPFIADLGIAMQITNICSEVLKDAHSGYVYLPEDRLARLGYTSEDILANQVPVQVVSTIVRELLTVADAYYESGIQGLNYWPWRKRLIALVTVRVHRAIGLKLSQRDFNPLLGPIYVSSFEKVAWGLKACVEFALRSKNTERLKKETSHNSELHWALKAITQLSVPSFSALEESLPGARRSHQPPFPIQKDF